MCSPKRRGILSKGSVSVGHVLRGMDYDLGSRSQIIQRYSRGFCSSCPLTHDFHVLPQSATREHALELRNKLSATMRRPRVSWTHIKEGGVHRLEGLVNRKRLAS